MARKRARPQASPERTLEPLRRQCARCGKRLWLSYFKMRTLATLTGLVHLTLKIGRCPNAGCARYHRPYRPEEEGALALPQGEFGLDVIAFVGARRYEAHASVAEIHRALQERGVSLAERTVTNLLHRYEALVAVHLGAASRLQERWAEQGRVILALDGLQPDVGHAVLWVLRDCLSGEVLLARSLLRATAADLADLLRAVATRVAVPIVGVVSAGQRSIRCAVAQALPAVP